MSRGTIEKRISDRTGKTSWIARWSFSAGTGRRHHREKSFHTRKEAADFLTKVQHELRSQTYVEPSREPVGDYLAAWVASLSTNGRTSSTLYAYDLMVRKRYTLINALPLADVRPSHLEALITEWEREGLASHTRNSAFRMLRVAFNDAVRLGKLVINPTDRVQAPRIERYQPNVWSADEIRQFLAFTKDSPDGLMWELVFRTLIRKGELITLQWRDIDFEAGTLTVRRTVRRQKDGSWGVGETPKSESSARVIPLGAELVARLRQHRAAQRADHLELGIPSTESSWIFERRDRADGDRHQGSAVFERWKWAVKKSGLRMIRLHDARHSGATLMIASGVPVKTVSQILGHADAAFTMRVYVHPGDDERRSATELIDRILDAG